MKPPRGSIVTRADERSRLVTALPRISPIFVSPVAILTAVPASGACHGTAAPELSSLRPGAPAITPDRPR